MHRNEFLERAVELASENVRQCGGGPFGAVIVRSGQVVAEAVNMVVQACDPTAHAEVVAIRKACAAAKTHSLNGFELYASCEPCPMCLAAMFWAGIDKFYFAATRQDAENAGFSDAAIYREMNLDCGKRSVPGEHVALARAMEPFQLWGESISKIPY